MSTFYKTWRNLFLFCSGLLLAASFAMKWIENDLLYSAEKISIMGLELFYDKEKIEAIFRGMDEPVKAILRYHLTFDFVFMAGCFPAIASLCMMAKEKAIKTGIQKLLLSFAMLQLIAWVCDIFENSFLFSWINHPDVNTKSFRLYHVIVVTKWGIAIAGAIIGLLFIFRKTRGAK